MSNIFKADEEKSQASGSNFLSVPYLGPVSIVDVKVDKVSDTENCFIAKVKLLGEDINGNDVSGLITEYVEWNPTEKSVEKQEKAVNRLNYFAQHIAPKDEALEVEGRNWEEYANKIVQLLKRHDVTEKTDLRMKFVGSVWQGNPRVDVPRYHAFIENSDSAEPLEWSQDEQESNREYLEVKNSSPTNPEEAEEIEDLEDQQF